MKLLFVNLLVSVGVVACAATPMPDITATTPKQAVLVSNYSLEAMNKTVSHMYCPDPPECLLGTISKARAKELRAQLKHAEDILDLADAAVLAGDLDTATLTLQQVDALLLELKKQLAVKPAEGVH